MDLEVMDVYLVTYSSHCSSPSQLESPQSQSFYSLHRAEKSKTAAVIRRESYICQLARDWPEVLLVISSRAAWNVAYKNRTSLDWKHKDLALVSSVASQI